MSNKIPPPVACPQCGRKLNIPPGKGKVNLACKGCLHLYSFDYSSGQMNPRGKLEPANSPHSRRKRLVLLFAILLLGTAIGLFFYMKNANAPRPIILDPKAEHTLEDIQKQLKSLTE